MITIEEYYDLSHQNTFGIDAKARYYCEVNSLDDLEILCQNELFHSHPRFILGGGSNILFTSDLPGLCIHPINRGIEILSETDDGIFIRVEAGENWSELVEYTVAQGWSGLENLAYIPGHVGAAPVQNVGAYGAEAKDCIFSVTAYNYIEHRLENIPAHKCGFAYRQSVFKGEAKDIYVILSVVFRLSKQPLGAVSYGDIRHVLGEKIPTPQNIASAVTTLRKNKLPDVNVLGSAGSFFKNPVVSQAMFANLQQQFPDIKAYPQNSGMKLAAGWLIEQCGFKGFRQGDAGVHQHQALVLVNYGHATGSQIIALAQHIAHTVSQRFGVTLETEVICIPDTYV